MTVADIKEYIDEHIDDDEEVHTTQELRTLYGNTLEEIKSMLDELEPNNERANQEIMRDRIRYQIKNGAEFSDFLGTIQWTQEGWIEKYNNSEEAIKDLLDLWYEVKEEI